MQPSSESRPRRAYVIADDRLWNAFWIHKRGRPSFRINRFCEEAVLEALPPIDREERRAWIEAARARGWPLDPEAALPDFGPSWVNTGETCYRNFDLPADVAARAAWYATQLHTSRSALLCTLIRRKQERAGIAL